MRGLALIALVVAGAARAQPVVTRFDIDNQEVLRLNAEDCDIATARMFLQVQVTEPQYQLRFVEYPRSGPLGACPLDRNEPLATEVFAEEQQIPVGTEILLQRDLARPALLGDGACPTDTTPGLGRRAENFFCVQFFLLPGDLNAVGAAQVSIDVDTTVPPVPTLTRIDAIDQTVTVGVEAITPPEGDAVSFVVQHRRCATSTGEGEGEGEGEAGNESEGEGEGEGEGEAVASLCGATGGFTEEKGSAPAIAFDVDTNDDLELRVFAVDDFGNASAPTELVLVSPAASLSALALYDGDANALSCAPSGCGDTDAAGLVGALALLRLRPRRRRATCSPPSTTSRGSAATTRASGGVAVALLVVLGAAPAHAGEDERLWPGLGRTTVSLGVSSWLPNLDAQTTFPVYGCLFDDATQARVGGDGDLHLWDGFGSIAVTAGLELAQASGFAQPVTTATSRTCGKPTSTTVNLTAAMGRLGLTYRFDPLLDAWSVPLVPYGRVGLLSTGYLFSKDGTSDTSSKTHNPVGARFGYEAAGGLMLALDFLDVIDPFSPGTTRRARASGVFDHTFLFVEGAFQDVTSFGAPGFDLSPRDDFGGTGLPVSWRAGLAVELL